MGRAEEGQRGVGPRDRQAVLCGPSKEAVAARGGSGRFWGSDPHAAGAAQGSGQGRSELCFRGNCSLRVEQKAERSVAAGRPERGAPQPAGGGREAHRGSVPVGGCCGARRYGQHGRKGKDGAEAPARAEGGWQCHAQMWGARAGSASLREGALGPLLDPWSLRCQCDRQMETLRSRGTRGSEASAVNVASRPGSARMARPHEELVEAIALDENMRGFQGTVRTPGRRAGP